ncbi:CHASE2 domain-containing protein [Desulfococcaceae bacterium HSG8]|nr:CHASE2 domain-containing protein [Desulfococcaceae bacterium HSG8]
MTYFVYPNANIKSKQFEGLGIFEASSLDKEPSTGYKIANNLQGRTVRFTETRHSAVILAPDSAETGLIIYEKKEDNFIGDSLDLAYLLALISRSRKLRFKTDGIWSTGQIDIKGTRPYLKAVDFEGFDIKLDGFLSEKTNEKLFIVPEGNIQHKRREELIKTKDVRILTLNQFKYSDQKKTILEVQGDQLDLLVKKIFKPKLSLPSLPDPKTILLVIFAVSLLFWTQAFEFIYLDSKIERLTISLGDVFIEKNFRNDIALIAIEDENFDINWRGRHAMLIAKLCEAGARIIAFDMYFEDTSDFDEDFVGSVKQAKKHGTDVIIGVSQFLGKKPEEIKKLEEAVSGYGTLCISETLLYSIKAPLLVIKENGDHLDSLSLIIAKTFYSQDIVEVKEKGSILKIPDKPIMEISLSEVEFSRDSCPSIREGDQVANIFIDLSPVGVLKSPERRFVYSEIISSWSDSRLRQQFEGKIVLVGVQVPKRDCLSVRRGLENEKCAFGMELHADILNTILSGIHTHVLLKWKQIAFIFVFTVSGAFLACIRNMTSRSFRISLLLLNLTFIFEASLYSYIQYRVLLNTAYYAAALIFAYIGERLSSDKKT